MQRYRFASFATRIEKISGCIARAFGGGDLKAAADLL